jgi:hypothetical protein
VTYSIGFVTQPLDFVTQSLDSVTQLSDFVTLSVILRADSRIAETVALSKTTVDVTFDSSDSGLRSNELGGKSERFESHLRASQILLKI